MNNMRKWINLVEAKQQIKPEEVIIGLKERDPIIINFAQSVGMPPALINQYSELAQQAEQGDLPRKVKIAFLNAEEEIFDFFSKKIETGLSKKISRRDLFRGAGNFAAMASQLGNVSKLMQALPKSEPKVTPPPTYVDWMTDDKVLEMLPYEIHEEFLNLFTSGPLPKEEYILQVNDWFDEKQLPWHATDMKKFSWHATDMKEGDDNFIWKLTRTKSESEKSTLMIQNAWGEDGEIMTLYRNGKKYEVEIDGSNEPPDNLLDYLHEFGISPNSLNIVNVRSLSRGPDSENYGTLIWHDV